MLPTFTFYIFILQTNNSNAAHITLSFPHILLNFLVRRENFFDMERTIPEQIRMNHVLTTNHFAFIFFMKILRKSIIFISFAKTNENNKQMLSV